MSEKKIIKVNEIDGESWYKRYLNKKESFKISYHPRNGGRGSYVLSLDISPGGMTIHINYDQIEEIIDFHKQVSQK